MTSPILSDAGGGLTVRDLTAAGYSREHAVLAAARDASPVPGGILEPPSVVVPQVSPQRPVTASRHGRAKPASTSPKRVRNRDAAAIRAEAARLGIAVSPKGRIPSAVIAQIEAARK